LRELRRDIRILMTALIGLAVAVTTALVNLYR
jgi:hypothetical protein